MQKTARTRNSTVRLKAVIFDMDTPSSTLLRRALIDTPGSDTKICYFA